MYENTNNVVSLVGELTEGFTFSHEVFGEGFYTTSLAVRRLSGKNDIVQVLVSERLVDISADCIGASVQVKGQFRSYNQHDDEGKTHLILSVFIREICFPDMDADVRFSPNETNSIVLNGFICKKPIFRKTPLGREVSDLLIAVNRPYGKADYIPCISWGRNAIFNSTLEIGTAVEVVGRIQSRDYVKRTPEGEAIDRVAYEVSVSSLTVK